MNRYHRQTLLPQIGSAGQASLASARVLLVGCGALGTVLADQLVRAGVGALRLVDRDVVEWTNLQRQVLYDEDDARAGAPKAVAAARRLGRVNSEVAVEPLATDVHAGNVESLAGCEPGGRPVDLILDGTDNAETRYLLNDVAVKYALPWVYGACVGTEGRVMAVRPPATTCLRCVFPDPPGPGELPTCDTAGVLGPAAAVVASLQATAALQILTGQAAAAGENLISFDLWAGRFRRTSLGDAKNPDCPTCGRRRFEFLDGRGEDGTVSLCGRDAVQVRPAGGGSVDLAALAARLGVCGMVERTPHLLRWRIEEGGDFKMTVFADGRAILHGVTEPDRARSLYAKWVGT